MIESFKILRIFAYWMIFSDISTSSFANEPSAQNRVLAKIHRLGGLVDREGKWPNRKVVHVSLCRTDAKDKDLQHLKHFPALRSVNLAGCELTGRGLIALKKMPKLVKLDLFGTLLNDEGMKSLGELKSLQVLNLSLTDITDKGLKHLANLKHLQKLNLQGTKINGTGLDSLKDLVNLKQLNLTNTPITDATIKPLGILSQLERLYIAKIAEHPTMLRNPFRDEAMEVVSRLTNLRELHCSLTWVTAKGLSSLSQLQKLETLVVNRRFGYIRAKCDFTKQELEQVAKLKSLRNLDFKGVGSISGTTLATLAKLKNLEKLSVGSLYIENNEDAKFLAKLSSLVSLEIQIYIHNPKNVNVCLQISKLKKLRRLIIKIKSRQDYNIKPVIKVDNLKFLGNLSNLKTLIIYPHPGLDITKGVIQSFSKLIKLEHFHLSNIGNDVETDNIKEESAPEVSFFKEMSALKHLRQLSIPNSKIANSDYRYLCHLSNMELLNLSGCNVSKDIFVYISSLTNLRHLEIDSFETGNVEGADNIKRNLMCLSKLVNLESLHTDANKIPPTSLKQLSSLKYLRMCNIGQYSIDDYRKVLPTTRIRYFEHSVIDAEPEDGFQRPECGGKELYDEEIDNPKLPKKPIDRAFHGLAIVQGRVGIVPGELTQNATALEITHVYLGHELLTGLVPIFPSEGKLPLFENSKPVTPIYPVFSLQKKLQTVPSTTGIFVLNKNGNILSVDPSRIGVNILRHTIYRPDYFYEYYQQRIDMSWLRKLSKLNSKRQIQLIVKKMLSNNLREIEFGTNLLYACKQKGRRKTLQKIMSAPGQSLSSLLFIDDFIIEFESRPVSGSSIYASTPWQEDSHRVKFLESWVKGKINRNDSEELINHIVSGKKIKPKVVNLIHKKRGMYNNQYYRPLSDSDAVLYLARVLMTDPKVAFTSQRKLLDVIKKEEISSGISSLHGFTAFHIFYKYVLKHSSNQKNRLGVANALAEYKSELTDAMQKELIQIAKQEKDEQVREQLEKIIKSASTIKQK